MNTHQNIHEAKLAVMQDVPYLQKRTSKELKYTFAGEADLIQKVRPSMLEHGIDMSPVDVQWIGTAETKSSTGKIGCIVRAIFTYQFTHSPSGTFVLVKTIGEAGDWGDKACNKAMTIAEKYAIRQFLLIETGDDPDVVAHNRAAENSDWVQAAVKRIENTKDEPALDALVVKMRGRDDKTGEPYFDEDQMPEIVMYAERHRIKLRAMAT